MPRVLAAFTVAALVLVSASAVAGATVPSPPGGPAAHSSVRAVSSTAVPSAAPAGIAVVRAVAGAPESARHSVALPTVSGAFGHAPSISWPSSKPPTTLVAKVLASGRGATVAKGDLVAVNYTGWIWRGKVFDSSFVAKFGHQTPFATAVGVSPPTVVAGWNDSLPGTKVGSRLLLVVPPRWGYGKSGQSSAGITGTDTIVFVVDVLGAWGKNAGAGAGGSRQPRSWVSSVSGDLDAQPSVHVAAGAPKPKAQSDVVLDRGREPVKGGLVVYQEYVADWSGKTVQSTWAQGRPTDSSFSLTSSSGDPFAGIPVGSRVLFEEPKSSEGGPYAIVVDLVANLT